MSALPAERVEATELAIEFAERREAERLGLTAEEYRAKLAEGRDLELEHEQIVKIVPDLKAADYLLDTQFPPPTFAVDPIHPRGQVSEAVGAHGIFKSTLELTACACVAAGRRFGGLPVVQGRAVFITAEDDEATIARRLRAWLESIPVGDERRRATAALRRDFVYLTREDVRHLSLTFVEHGEPAQRAGVVKRLVQLVTGVVLVVLETAARLAEGDENANRIQAAFATALEEIAQKSGAAVVIVRHVSKAAALDGRSDSYVGRGGGALSDAARSVVVFTRPASKGEDEPDPLAPVVMAHRKASLSRPAPRITWQPVEVPGVGVYMRALSDDEELRANASKLLAAMPPEGITESELHKRPLAGLGRVAARAALKQLEQLGALAVAKEDRGRNKQVSVYRVAGGQP